MGIDVGQKRIGLAVTDPLRIISTGLDTIPVSQIFTYLSEYVRKEKVDIFVVGSPVTMSNQPSEASKYVDPFVRKLKKMFGQIPVRLMDERYTSSLAKQTIIDLGIGKVARRDKGRVDKISAVIILQSFLDQEN